MKNSSSTKDLPFFYVGKAITDNRKEKFKREKYESLCEKLGKQDTQSIWYSRQHISTLLEEIDHAGGDGIRLHFGAYEDDHDYEGQLCLVMNITRSSSGSRKDIILEEESDFKDRSSINRGNNGNNVNQIRRDFNFGFPCPPRCNGDDGVG